MKVGTDGVLLGAWTSLEGNPLSILDIGAGTGLVALILAQRSNADSIDALEIEGSAFEQCVENFEASPWADRLYCYHASLEAFVAEPAGRYDLIVSNPPFYSETVPGKAAGRDMARQNQSLPFEALLEGVAKLLNPSGRFSVIIPFKEESKMLSIAEAVALFPLRITRVKGHPGASVKRSLLEFTFHTSLPQKETLVIEEGRHQYTPEYRALTSEFYLNM